MNLVPETPSTFLNYWCAWNAQHPMWYLRTDDEYARFDHLTATEGGNADRGFMNELFLKSRTVRSSRHIRARSSHLVFRVRFTRRCPDLRPFNPEGQERQGCLDDRLGQMELVTSGKELCLAIGGL
jgi:hypothetical protein